MKLFKIIIISTVALALAGQFSTLTARDSIDQRLIEEAMPMVEKNPDSFLVQAPYINNLVVMNVRVYNQQGEQVLYVRSRGEAVELFAADLPDGKYSYQVNTVFGLDEPMGEGADAKEEGISRQSDSFIIRDGKLIEPENRSVSMNQSPFERILQHSMVLTGELLSLFVSDAQAVVTEHEWVRLKDNGPALVFDHTSIGLETEEEFMFWVQDTADLPTFYLSSAVWTGFDNIMVIHADYLAETEANLSWVVEAAGDMSWSGGGMFFDRSHRILSIGSKAPGLTQDFYISNVKPGQRFHDEADSSEVEMELSAGDFRFWGRADDSTAPWSIPFRIDVNAPTNSLAIASDGTVTMGSNVHIGADTTTGHSLMITSTGPANPPEIDLNYPGNSGVEIEMSDSRLRFNFDSNGDDGINTFDVLNINKFALANSLSISAAGNIGNGIFFPLAPVHVQRANGTAKILVEETDASKGPRTLFEIKNNGNPEFRMSNSGNGNSWLFSAGLRFVVKNNAGDWVSRVDAAGNMEITGSLTTTGGTCGGGCDLVFDPETSIESIEEHAFEMWANSYLPAVGPTVENEPFNLTEKTGGMLNELEKAHIYIEQLHQRLAELEANPALAEKIDSLEATVAQQRKEYAELKAMVIDLQMQSSSGELLTSLK